MPNPRGRLILACVFIAAAGLSACGSNSGTQPKDGAGTVVLSPLSGKPVTSADQSVLVVKVENTSAARPHIGLSSADIVYVEQVEGGISRFAVVFSSTLPGKVGPIRSARITDPDLVAQFGHVAFAYSGVQPKMVPVLAAANMTLLREVRSKAWLRDKNRSAPHNLFGVPEKLLQSAKEKGTPIAVAHDMGWVFDAAVPEGGKPVTQVVAPYPAENITIDSVDGQWRLTSGRDVLKDGSRTLHPATILIQFVVQHASSFHGHNGSPTPYAETIGSGSALLLRDGRLWQIQWSRKDAAAPTVYTDDSGQTVHFAPGGMWVMLMDKSRKVSVAYAASTASAAASTPAP
jgi:hypothetical protein